MPPKRKQNQGKESRSKISKSSKTTSIPSTSQASSTSTTSSGMGLPAEQESLQSHAMDRGVPPPVSSIINTNGELDPLPLITYNDIDVVISDTMEQISGIKNM